MSSHRKMLAACSILLLIHSIELTDALIVPQELPTILSLIYSNIPVLKKGTDSRLGFGFRLGEHADFQVLLELGPQKETRPIGDQESSDNSFNKRQVTKKEQNALLKELWKQQQKQQFENYQSTLTSTERNAASWLETWSQDMQSVNTKKKSNKNKGISVLKKPSDVPTAPVVAEQSMNQLQLLYKLATTTTTTTASPSVGTEVESTAKKEVASPESFSLPQHLIARLHQARSLKSPDPQHLKESEEKSKTEITKELMDVSLD